MTTGEMRPTVFLSYARADRPRVAPLADALAARGHDVWWDALIDGGAAFSRTIEAQLAAADAIIVIWSATSIRSDWVRDEADQGRQRQRLVPVTLDGTLPPLGFGQYHCVDLSRWRGEARAAEIDSLVRGIAEASGAEAPARVHAALPGPRLSRRTALIAGGGVAALAAVRGIVVFRPFGGGTIANSVAVLPFSNLSADPAQAYFAEGLSEEVRSALARNATLKVAALTSSTMVRDEIGDVKAIASKLGVAYVLEGSVRKAGDIVRISADLIDTRTGFSSWAQSFDRSLDNILSVQSEIADTVAAALAVKVDAAARTPGSTTSVVAYDAFLHARALYNADAGEASDRAALAQLDVAIGEDPDYAAALALHARLATGIADQYGSPSTLRAAYDAAIAMAQRAVAIAPALVEAQLALGYVLFSGRVDVRGARGPFDRAYALGAGDADILVPCAFYFAHVGRGGDAESAVGRAVTLDPLNARVWRSAGVVEYTKRRYRAAIEPWKHALALNPSLSLVWAMRGAALFQLGQLADARAAFAAEPNELFRLTGLAIVDRKLGDAAAAEASLSALVAGLGDNSLYQQAQIFAQWGQPDQAVAMLEKARQAGDSGLIYTLTDPMLDPLRKLPRFSALLKVIGFV